MLSTVVMGESVFPGTGLMLATSYTGELDNVDSMVSSLWGRELFFSRGKSATT